MFKYHLTISLFLFSICTFSQNNNPKVNPIWKNHIHEFTNEITSLKSDDYSDLEFLKSILEDKQFVFLGESREQLELEKVVKLN